MAKPKQMKTSTALFFRLSVNAHRKATLMKRKRGQSWPQYFSKLIERDAKRAA